MQASRVIISGVLALSFLFVSAGRAVGADKTDDPAALLKEGIELFNHYKFAKANKTLRTARKYDNKLKRLTADQRKQLDDYLDESVKARRQYEEAVEFMALAKRLLADPTVADVGLAQVEGFYKDALARQKYLPLAKIAEAKKGLAKASRLRKALTPTTAAKKAQAAKPTIEKKPAVQTKSKAKADKPAKKPQAKTARPETKAKKKRRKTPRAVAVSAQPAAPTVLDRILQGRKVQRQQALAGYRDAESRVRAAVDARQFLGARDALSQARQAIYRSRRLFSASEFERLLLQVDSLAKFIDTEEREFQKEHMAAQMKEADKKRAEREVRVQQEKFDKIAKLFTEARDLARQREYDQAIEACRQILAIEPTSVRARDLMEIIEDVSSYRTQRGIKEEHDDYARQLFDEGDKSRIPYIEEIRWPKDWLQRARSRKDLMRRLNKKLVGEAPARLTERKLQARIVEDMSVLRGTLQKAFNYFKGQGIKLFVRWDSLEFEGVVPDNDVNFESLEGLQEISLRSALELLLKTLGSEVNYAINTDGFVVVSTRDSLRDENLTPRMGRLETRVHPIADIMAYQVTLSSIPEVEPNQEEESIELEEIEAKEFDELETLEELVDQLTELIVSLVRPDSWGFAGGEGTIDVWRRRNLIVYQTPEVHDEIDALLEELRETQTIQIAMEARFITVSSNFLENIGVDLDVIFNQGHAGYDFTGAENTWGNQVPNGFGSQLVQPRVFSQLGALPVSPVAGAVAPPVGWVQPYGHFGLIPPNGNTGFRSTKWTSIPLLNGTTGLVTPESTGLPGSLAGTVGPAFQVMGAFLDDLQVNFLIEATQMDRYSSIVQSPRVIMQNGAMGYIAVMTDVPYVEEVEVQLGESSGGTEPQVETMGFGTVLAVRPTTRDLRYVNMYVVPQVTLRAPDADLIYENTVVSQGAVSVISYLYPGRRTTRVETTVSVPDGGTLLLGGLKQAGEIEREAGVPILSKIPGLKRFFSNRSLVKDNFTLLILIKPKILIREELEPGYFSEL